MLHRACPMLAGYWFRHFLALLELWIHRVFSYSLPTIKYQGATCVLFDLPAPAIAFEESDVHHLRQDAVVMLVRHKLMYRPYGLSFRTTVRCISLTTEVL